MADYKVVDSTQLDADLANIANAIRAKTGVSGEIPFPGGFTEQISAIQSGYSVEDFYSPDKGIEELNYSGTSFRGVGYLFYDMKTLKKIDLPNVTWIPNRCFYGCENLATVSIPSCKDIDTRSFSRCKNLETIDLGENIETIGTSAFDTCSNLKTVIIRNKTAVVNLADVNAFLGTHFDTEWDGAIYVPDELFNAYQEDTNWCYWGAVYEGEEWADLIKPLSEYEEG